MLFQGKLQVVPGFAVSLTISNSQNSPVIVILHWIVAVAKQACNVHSFQYLWDFIKNPGNYWEQIRENCTCFDFAVSYNGAYWQVIISRRNSRFWMLFGAKCELSNGKALLEPSHNESCICSGIFILQNAVYHSKRCCFPCKRKSDALWSQFKMVSITKVLCHIIDK